MPFTYSEGFHKYKGEIFRIERATSFPYRVKVFKKSDSFWEEVPHTDSLYIDVLYYAKPCDEEGNVRALKATFWQKVVDVFVFVFLIAIIIACAMAIKNFL